MDRQEIPGRRGLQAQKVPSVGGEAVARRRPSDPRGALREQLHHAAHDAGAEQAERRQAGRVVESADQRPSQATPGRGGGEVGPRCISAAGVEPQLGTGYF